MTKILNVMISRV